MSEERVKQNYIQAMQQLMSKDGYIRLVDLMLAVPVERKGKDPLTRRITSDYKTPARPNHLGIDFNGGPWADGYHPHLNFLGAPAKVTRAEKTNSYGNVIDITVKTPYRLKGKAKNGEVTIRRAHCHTLFAKKGNKLDLWQRYATLGNTGDSTGPHEHLEAFVDGVRVNPHDLEIHVPFMSGQETYIVQPGDTYWKISQMTGVPVEKLREWNGWPDREIPKYAIMWLVEPPKDAPAPEPPNRPKDPPHPEVTKEEFEQLLDDFVAMTNRVIELEKKLEAVKMALQ